MLDNSDKKWILELLKDSFKQFWDGALEPALNTIHDEISGVKTEINSVKTEINSVKTEIREVKEKVDNLENKVDDISLDVKSQGRKLDAEIRYRDHLEKRVQTLEKAH